MTAEEKGRQASPETGTRPSPDPVPFNLSVKNLVAFTLHAGDLGGGFTPPDRAVEGTRMHKKIQASRPECYTAEVPVTFQVQSGRASSSQSHDLIPDETICNELNLPPIILKLRGRIDGIFRYPDRIVIDEIKTTYRNLTDLEAHPDPLHWGQAKIYGHILIQQENLSGIDVQLTYCQMETGQVKEMVRSYSQAELSEFFDPLISKYLDWIGPVAGWRAARDESIGRLEFPFGVYRPGQREMAVQAYLAIKHGGRLLVQAPTGIGKTAAAIFPALKALAEGHTKTVVYLTARTTGRLAAEETLAVMRREGLKIKSLSLTAKEKLCPVPDLYCRPDECPYALGYYDRIDGALKEAFSWEVLSGEEMVRLGMTHQVCPFELSLDIAFWVDVVIGDYNYAFDPHVFLKRFFIEYGGNDVFLVDEAHHLVDRGRSMFSAAIEKKPILDLSRLIKADLPELATLLKGINKWLIEARKKCETKGGFFSENTCPADLTALMTGFQEKAAERLAKGMNHPYAEAFTAQYLAFGRFIKTARDYDEHYATCYQKERNDLKLTLFCLDPSTRLDQALKRSRSAVFFSATLTPMSFYRDLLGCRETAPHLTLPSPFPPERLCLLVEGRISTKFHHREQTKEDIAGQILDLVRGRPGNYLVFFPSYAYLNLVHRIFEPMATQMEIIRQEPGMDESARGAFLERFNRGHRKTLVGFAVMGGIFGEGIDLTGDRLTGAVIVGVGLPAFDAERDLIRRHFAQTHRQGFEYAYQYPGFTRVLQAVGRVIRSEDDRGVVLLIDQRFGSGRYRALFPETWRPRYLSEKYPLKAAVDAFWQG